MLLDSFYEGVAPASKTLGVSRLNTRFAFYAYERRRLTATRVIYSNSQVVKAKSACQLGSETGLVRYVF